MRAALPDEKAALPDFRLCANGWRYQACNWLVNENDPHPYCFACRFNRIILDMVHEQNLLRFRCFEQAKKRLLFTLLELQIPLHNGFDSPHDGLLFDLVEDQRTAPERYIESFVHTGFKGGVITINALEADDVFREQIKREMNEPYRTLLGHLRHEIGHYYWSILSLSSAMQIQFQKLFGDVHQDYKKALEHYYNNGNRQWHNEYISRYASAHPLEDWAETWGHYLHIYDALDTAFSYGSLAHSPATMDIGTRISTWMEWSIMLNELNRSMGIDDPYPFVLNAQVIDKLTYVNHTIEQLRVQEIRAPVFSHRR